MSRSIRLLLADDHALVRKGLRLILAQQPGFNVVAEASDGHEAVALARQHRPDVALMDIAMPRLSGVMATREMLEQAPGSQVLILSMHGDAAYVRECLRAGAKGYLLKDAVDHELVPTAVFSTPEIGTVGLPEDVARERHPRLDVYKARFRPLKHSLSGRDEFMLMKLLVDGDTDKVVGCHILGPDAAEMVQLAAIALRMGASKADFDATMALHPTAAEELVTLRQKWVPPA